MCFVLSLTCRGQVDSTDSMSLSLVAMAGIDPVSVKNCPCLSWAMCYFGTVLSPGPGLVMGTPPRPVPRLNHTTTGDIPSVPEPHHRTPVLDLSEY